MAAFVHKRALTGHTACLGANTDVSLRTLRRFLSIVLLAVFCLPFLSPLLAQGAEGEAGLPACCRKHGTHHCMMDVGTQAQQTRLAQQQPAFKAPAEKCPYCPGTIVSVHGDVYAAPTAEASFVSLASHPSGVAQTESRRRISKDRSRQKRGPPTSLSL